MFKDLYLPEFLDFWDDEQQALFYLDHSPLQGNFSTFFGWDGSVQFECLE
jgi:hypothetical protein